MNQEQQNTISIDEQVTEQEPITRSKNGKSLWVVTYTKKENRKFGLSREKLSKTLPMPFQDAARRHKYLRCHGYTSWIEPFEGNMNEQEYRDFREKLYPGDSESKHIRNEFPELFKDCKFGCEFGNGWGKVIRELCSTLEKMGKKEGQIPLVAQVKEKFGSLRFYAHNLTPEMQAAISKAEIETASICEYCGRAGVIRETKSGWVKCMCPECAEDRC